MRPAVFVTTLAIALVTFSARSSDDPPFEGGIVAREDAPVYAASKGDEVVSKIKRGESVAITNFISRSWFVEVDGRVQVYFLVNTGGKAGYSGGWMDPKNLARFTYYGACARYNWDEARRIGGGPTAWDDCFIKARDKKLKELASKR
jgi:hypothetical protein